MKARLAALLLACFVAVAGPAAAEAPFGRYHALVIGINDYRAMPNLKTAVNDASAVHDVLIREYGYESTLLLNPTRYDIVSALDRYRAELGENDNLLIYYAGHGVLDRESDQGYWLPIDAEPDSPANWVPIFTVTATLKAMSAKHVLVVADSCYSGALTRSAPARLAVGGDRQRELARMAEKRARKALVSGGLEPVFDGGGDGHSVFARAFIEALQGNREVLDGRELYLRVRQPVVAKVDQTPEYSDIRRSGDEGGDFLFVPRNRTPQPASASARAAPAFDERAAELAFWNAAESSPSASAYQAYLNRYPLGMFAELARIRLGEMEPRPAREQQMAATAPPRPPAPPPAARPTPALVVAPPKPQAPAGAEGAWRGGQPACLRAMSGHEVDIELELQVTEGTVEGRLIAESFGPQSRDLGWTRTHENLEGKLDASGEFKGRSSLFSAPIAVRFPAAGAQAEARIGRCEISLERTD